MKTYGSAVLTALQAQYKSIDEIDNLVRERLIGAFLRGRDLSYWIACFWKQIAIIEGQRTDYETYSRKRRCGVHCGE